MPDQTMQFSHQRIASTDLLIWCHTGEGCSDEEWAMSLSEVEKVIALRGGSVETLRTIVTSDGGGPTTKQRAHLFAEVYHGERVKVAAFSPKLNNPVTRGILTAVMWLNPGAKPFAYRSWEEGMVHLGLEGQVKDVVEGLVAMKETFESPALTDLIDVMRKP